MDDSALALFESANGVLEKYRAGLAALLEEHTAVQEERDRYREALAILADDSNWSSDPRSHDAVLYGHDTPYELAVTALAGEER